MKLILIMSILLNLNTFAKDWSMCQKWLSEQNYNMTGQFQDINITSRGKINPADTAKGFDTKDGKSFTMKVPSARVAFNSSKVRVMKTTATEMNNEIRVVRKWQDNKIGLVKDKYKTLDKIQKYQILSLKVLPSGKCVPMYKADFEYELSKGMKSLIGRNDFFAPYCMELRFGYKKMSINRKNIIANNFNSKTFLNEAKAIVEEVYPEPNFQKSKFKHVQAKKSVNETLDEIKQRCFDYNMESIEWAAWDNADYKGAELSVESNFEISESGSEVIRRALNK